MYMTLCPKHAEMMMATYWLSEASRPHLAKCAQCITANITTVTQYEITPKNRPRSRKRSGPAPRDRRARWREPFRDESDRADW